MAKTKTQAQKTKTRGPRLTASGARIGRPPRETPTIVVALRLDTDIVEALDALGEKIGRDLPGMIVSRNDVLRRLIVTGLRNEGFDPKKADNA